MQTVPAAWPPSSPPRPPRPAAPAPAGASARVQYRLPTDELVLVGAHGGAGVSTLTALLGGRKVWDLGVIPAPHLKRGRTLMRLDGRTLALVARGNVPCAAHATTATRTMVRSGIPVTSLIVVADGAGPEPREATARFRLLEAHLTGELIRMPFLPALRLVDAPADVELSRAAARALQTIRDLPASRSTPAPGRA